MMPIPLLSKLPSSAIATGLPIAVLLFKLPPSAIATGLSIAVLLPALLDSYPITIVGATAVATYAITNNLANWLEGSVESDVDELFLENSVESLVSEDIIYNHENSTASVIATDL